MLTLLRSIGCIPSDAVAIDPAQNTCVYLRYLQDTVASSRVIAAVTTLVMACGVCCGMGRTAPTAELNQVRVRPWKPLVPDSRASCTGRFSEGGLHKSLWTVEDGHLLSIVSSHTPPLGLRRGACTEIVWVSAGSKFGRGWWRAAVYLSLRNRSAEIFHRHEHMAWLMENVIHTLIRH